MKNFVQRLTDFFFSIIQVLLFVTCGTFSLLLLKFQDQCVTKIDEKPPTNFHFPFSQSIAIFFGNAIVCLPIHFLMKFFLHLRQNCSNPSLQAKVKTNKIDLSSTRDAKAEPAERGVFVDPIKKKKKVNQLVFIVPALLFFIDTCFANFSLVFIHASLFQMIFSSISLFTFILSIIFLKSKAWKSISKYFGLFFIITGVVIVSINSFFQTKNKDNFFDFENMLGIILVLSSTILFAVQFVVEEYILSTYDTNPFQLVGFEGYYCFLLMFIVLLVLFFTGTESFPNFLSHIANNKLLLLWVILMIIDVGFYNALGNFLTKNLSAAKKSTIDMLRIATIYGIELLRGKKKIYMLDFVGFVVLILGTSIFNEIGFNFFKRTLKKLTKIIQNLNIRKSKQKYSLL